MSKILSASSTDSSWGIFLKVETAIGTGIALGAIMGAIALGTIVTNLETQANARSIVWWIVVLTTIIPLVSYLKGELLLKGPWGGFLNGLGTGLGFFLLLVGKAT